MLLCYAIIVDKNISYSFYICHLLLYLLVSTKTEDSQLILTQFCSSEHIFKK